MRTADKTELETIEWLARIRWPNGIVCPSCASRDISELVISRGIWQCRSCRSQFGIFKGTRFEGTRLSPFKIFGYIFFYYLGSLQNYEQFYANTLDYKNKSISERWKGPIGVLALQEAIPEHFKTYSTLQRIHKKLRDVKFDVNMKLDEFISRLLS